MDGNEGNNGCWSNGDGSKGNKNTKLMAVKEDYTF
jgi:hypothetical protein